MRMRVMGPVGSRVRQLRKQAGLSQEALGVRAGLSGSTVRRVEAGEDSSLKSLRAIAQALDVDIFELLADPLPFP